MIDIIDICLQSSLIHFSSEYSKVQQLVNKLKDYNCYIICNYYYFSFIITSWIDLKIMLVYRNKVGNRI